MKGLVIRLVAAIALTFLAWTQLTFAVSGSSPESLLVLNKSENTLAIIDPVSFKVLARIPTGEAPHELTVSADGRLAFVCNYGTAERPGNTISVIDIANRESDTVSAIEPAKESGAWKITQIAVGKAPEGIGLSPDEREVWVAHRVDGGLSIIDTATNQVKETLKVGRAPIRVKFTPDGKRVLVSDSQGGEVVVFDAATRKELKRIAVAGGPAGIMIQPDGRRAFVASTQANKVVVISLQDFTVAGTIESGRGPDGMAWAK